MSKDVTLIRRHMGRSGSRIGKLTARAEWNFAIGASNTWVCRSGGETGGLRKPLSYEGGA